MQNTELPPYDAFYSKFRSCNPLEAEYTDYVNLLKNGLTAEQVSSFKHFLRWYNNKDVVPTLEAMQKMIAFYHD